MAECKDCIHFEVCAYVKRDLPACDSFLANAGPVVRCRECKYFNLVTHECKNELLSTDHEGGASYSLNFYDGKN